MAPVEFTAGASLASTTVVTRARHAPIGNEDVPKPTPQAVQENIDAIKRWERASLRDRSRAERLSDWVTENAAHGGVLMFHLVWFLAWIALNVGVVPGLAPFDPYPFSLLTMLVSLEAIFLSLFVLASQNRLSRQADKREHLDLQVDLLAEREETAMLRLLHDIARHLHVKTSVTAEQIRDLTKKTDLGVLTEKMEELREQPETQRAKPPIDVR